MANKRPKPEEIVMTLRQVELLIGQGMIRDVLRKWIQYRDQECLYVGSTDGIISDTPYILDSMGLSISYLIRLQQIQFDKDGLQEIDRVIAEYDEAVS